MQELAGILRSHGMKATPQRLAVASLLLPARIHLTPQQVRERLRDRYPSLSLNTIYQTLQRLAGAGLLRELNIGGRTWFDSHVEPHHHAVCRVCERIEDVPAAAQFVPLTLRRWKIEDEARIWQGLCPECREREKG